MLLLLLLPLIMVMMPISHVGRYNDAAIGIELL